MRVASFEPRVRIALDGRLFVLIQKSLTEDGKPAWIARRDDQVAVMLSEEMLLRRYAERELDFVVVTQPRDGSLALPDVPPDADSLSPGDRARITIRQAFLKALPDKLLKARVDDTPRSLRRKNPATLDAINAAWEEAREVASARANALFRLKDGGHLSRELARQLEAAATETPPAPKTVEAWRRLDQPSNPTALAGRLSLSGNRQQLPAWMRDIMDRTARAELDRLLTADPEVPREGAVSRILVAVDKAIKAHVAEHPEDGRGKTSVSKQAIYRVWQGFDAHELHVARHGPESAHNAFRHTVRAEMQTRALAEVDYDETRSNIWVAHPILGCVLGKATIGALRDRATNGLCGYAMGFEPASAATFMAALRHSLIPKQAVAHLYPDTVHPWLHGGVPGRVNIDNSFQGWSKAVVAAADDLRFGIAFARVRVPGDKWGIEGFFSSVESSLERLVPGYDRRRAGRTETFDPKIHTPISLDALDRLFHQWVCDGLHQRPVPRLGANPDELFRRLTLDHPVRYPASLDELDRILGQETEVTVDHNGCWYLGIQYSSTRVLDIRARRGARLKVRAKVPRHDLEYVYVQCPRTRSWERLCATDDFRQYTRGLPQHVHDLVRKGLADKGTDAQPGVRGLQAGLAELVSAVEHLVVEAKQGRYVARLGRALGAEAPHNALLARLPSMERVRERHVQPPISVAKGDSVPERTPTSNAACKQPGPIPIVHVKVAPKAIAIANFDDDEA